LLGQLSDFSSDGDDNVDEAYLEGSDGEDAAYMPFKSPKTAGESAGAA
jgi:hypothetical protein